MGRTVPVVFAVVAVVAVVARIVILPWSGSASAAMYFMEYIYLLCDVVVDGLGGVVQLGAEVHTSER